MAKFHNISLICAHAFYANLEDLYDKCPAHDIKIVLGDFNAKVVQSVQPPIDNFS